MCIAEFFLLLSRNLFYNNCSKQTWFHDRSFSLPPEYSESTIPKGMENPYKDGFLMATNLVDVPTLPTNITDYRMVLDPVAYKVTERIQLATQHYLLGVFSSESYQVANYGIGGQYGAHWDASDSLSGSKELPVDQQVYSKATGDRMSTFMAYLSDVEVGGSTAFPLLGIAAQPSKGDGVFWINLESSGKLNSLTSHSGCPVIVGSKWITNKWINYFDQYEKFKCRSKDGDAFEALNLFRQQNLALGKYYLK